MPTEDPCPSTRFGLATGWDPELRINFAAAVSGALRAGVDAIELSALSRSDLAPLADYLRAPASRELRRFDYVSLHAPAKHLLGPSSPRDGSVSPARWEEIVTELLTLPASPVSGIVFHPDTVPDPGLLAPLGRLAILENMDVRKGGCKTASELAWMFEALPEARFCLDVAHAWTIDPTLTVGHELLNAYGDRLAEVHVSGIEPAGHHRLTTEADLALYGPLLERCEGVPWILESPLLGSET